MSKKRAGRKAEGVLNIAEVPPTDGLPTGDSSTSWWAGLSRNSRLLTIGVIAFLSIGAVGAGLKYLEEDARTQNANASKDRSMLSSVNPFVSAPPPSPTPQLSKEYIYAGSRLLAVEDANANAAPPADLAIWRPSSGLWCVLGGPGSQQTFYPWGQSTDIPVQGDYDGDGKTDFSVFRPSGGEWYISQSSTGVMMSMIWGQSGDIPVAADFDGDGKTDVAVYRPSDGGWYIYRSSDGAYFGLFYGTSTDKPIPADFDGDGKADLALWRDSNANFYSLNSGDEQYTALQLGVTGDKPVPADYDGDGRADHAVRSGANWLIRNSSNPHLPVTTTPSGDLGTDIPVQNDYDGDGKVDIAVWRNSETYAGSGDSGHWYIRQSASNDSLRQVQWGMTGDIPVPAFYRR